MVTGSAAPKGIDDALLARVPINIIRGTDAVLAQIARMVASANAARDAKEAAGEGTAAPGAQASPSSQVASSTASPPGNGQGGPETRDTRQSLDVGEGDLDALVRRTWALIGKRNDPPRLYQSAAGLAYLARTTRGDRIVARHSIDSLRLHLAGEARCERWSSKGGNGGRMESVPPPDVLIRSLLATNEPPVPVVARVVEVPVFGRDGDLLTRAGYHAGSQTYYQPPPGLELPDVPQDPSQEERVRARQLLVEPLRDFPFTGPAEVAHAIAAMLLPFAREMISGPTPLHLIVKPTPGTGAGLLCDVIATLTTGQRAAPMAEARDEDEQRKRLTSYLAEGHGIILLDNLSRLVSGAPLAVALTADTWTDRLLGSTASIRVPVRCLWLATGNNVQTSTEMARRILRIRLDAHLDRPWERSPTDFRHPDLLGWVRARRGELVAAALTLIRAWVAVGRPNGARTLGSYEAWASVIGGILDVAGIPGFLENLDEFYAEADAEGAATRAFIQAWLEKFGGMSVTAGDLFSIANDTLDLGDGGDRSQRSKLGRRLMSLRDRVFGTLRIEAGGLRHSGRTWQLVEITDDGNGPRRVIRDLFGENNAADESNKRGTWGTSGELRFPSQVTGTANESRRGELGELFPASQVHAHTGASLGTGAITRAPSRAEKSSPSSPMLGKSAISQGTIGGNIEGVEVPPGDDEEVVV